MASLVVTCVDLVANPTAVAGAPCAAGQGLFTVTADLQPASAAFDGAMAGEFFFYAFGVVVFAYLLGFAIGQVRKPVRQGS